MKELACLLINFCFGGIFFSYLDFFLIWLELPSHACTCVCIKPEEGGVGHAESGACREGEGEGRGGGREARKGNTLGLATCVLLFDNVLLTLASAVTTGT